MLRIKELKPRNKRYRQGYYNPLNPSKYVGDTTNIIYRSRWEHVFMVYCDKNPDVINWSSESIKIPYINPINQKKYNYYPDFLIKMTNKDGNPEFILIEVKPSKQIKPPKYTCKYLKESRLKTYNKNMITYITNMAKFNAALDFAKSNGMKFMVLTEKDPPLNKSLNLLKGV